MNKFIKVMVVITIIMLVLMISLLGWKLTINALVDKPNAPHYQQQIDYLQSKGFTSITVEIHTNGKVVVYADQDDKDN